MKGKVCLQFLLCFCLFVGGEVLLAEDPDYGDIPEDAAAILTNGTIVNGVLESGDVDWFKFTPTANTLYRVTLNGQINSGYKEMDIYQVDEFDTLHKTIYHYSHSNGVSV
ncbi:MAG: hypothetical protein JXA82_11965, partial [Sedimentisphaerales bacterium]|nr:hypothetical protein [Sedimentisphaerales bacterium]